MHKLRYLAVVAAASFALSACTSAATSAPTAPPAATIAPASSAPATSAAPAAGAATATIVDFGFNPATLTVKAGTTVTWTNTGSAPHTVTADDGSFDSGSLNGGATFQQTFAKAGTYAYHCKIHHSMTAKVVVQP
jgi:plastocyanin